MGLFSFPSPYGLFLGLGSVLVGQVVVLAYYFFRRNVLKETKYIQVRNFILLLFSHYDRYREKKERNDVRLTSLNRLSLLQ